jgi:hypothetical protein
MTAPAPHCPECGTVWPEGQTCQDDFHQMLAWEFQTPRLWEVHHLTVLCYYLQHPSLYSPVALAGARQLLVEFVEQGAAPQEVRRRDRDTVDSSKRTWNFKGTTDAHGAYRHPIVWPMTAARVVAGGTEQYCANVRAWAASILAALRASGNLEAE